VEGYQRFDGKGAMTCVVFGRQSPLPNVAARAATKLASLRPAPAMILLVISVPRPQEPVEIAMES
jgi:hypothetical protein